MLNKTANLIYERIVKSLSTFVLKSLPTLILNSKVITHIEDGDESNEFFSELRNDSESNMKGCRLIEVNDSVKKSIDELIESSLVYFFKYDEIEYEHLKYEHPPGFYILKINGSFVLLNRKSSYTRVTVERFSGFDPTKDDSGIFAVVTSDGFTSEDGKFYERQSDGQKASVMFIENTFVGLSSKRFNKLLRIRSTKRTFFYLGSYEWEAGKRNFSSQPNFLISPTNSNKLKYLMNIIESPTIKCKTRMIVLQGEYDLSQFIVNEIMAKTSFNITEYHADDYNSDINYEHPSSIFNSGPRRLLVRFFGINDSIEFKHFKQLTELTLSEDVEFVFLFDKLPRPMNAKEISHLNGLEVVELGKWKPSEYVENMRELGLDTSVIKIIEDNAINDLNDLDYTYLRTEVVNGDIDKIIEIIK